MAHTYAAVFTSIWSDKDFCSLTAEAQRLYLFLLSQPSLSQVGYTDINLKKWSNKALNLEARDIEKQLAELALARYVVVDDATDELLVRTYVRNSGSWKQPMIVAAMASAVPEIESPKLRRALLDELDRLPLHELSDDPSPKGGPSHRAQVTLRLQTLRAAILGLPTCNVSLCEISGEGLREGLADPLGTGTGLGTSSPVGSNESSLFSSETSLRSDPDTPLGEPAAAKVDKKRKPRAKIADVVREDVEALCRRLAELVTENGNREPTISKAWRDSARLLLDKDTTGPNKERITFEKALRLIEWSQQDDFWAGNIHSMPTFRKQYDKLRSEALRKWREARKAPAMSKTQQRTANNRAMVEDAALKTLGYVPQDLWAAYDGPVKRNAWGEVIQGEVIKEVTA